MKFIIFSILFLIGFSSLFAQEPIMQLSGHNDEIRCVKFSPDGKLLASTGADCKIIVWDVKTGTKVFEIEKANKQALYSLAFSPDGKLLVSGGYEEIVFWKMSTGKFSFKLNLEGTQEHVTCLDYSPDGNYLVSGSKNTNGVTGFVTLHNALTQLEIHNHKQLETQI